MSTVVNNALKHLL